MTDPTTRPRSVAGRKTPTVRPKMVALAGVALMTLVLAALMFTLSFDALRALAIEIGARPERAWMAPVAIDIAQAAATAGLVVIGVADKYKSARWYCMGLATVTVLLSVAGNSYHAYGLSVQNTARVAAGENLGFIPQPPLVAAFIAAIFPLLWLALLHLGTIMLRVIVDERAQQTASATALEDEPNAATPKRNNAPAKRAAAAAPRTKTVAVVATRPDPVVHRDEDATQSTAAETRVAPPGEKPAATADVAVAASAPAVVGAVYETEADAPATRNGYPQTRDGLRRFLEGNHFTDQTTEVAAMLIDHPELRQVDVAQRLRVDKSTVCRRWKPFVAAAKAEGFTVPPLPRLTDVSEQVRELQPA
ncbi:DUF2637 domain-containing protein [Rhodococcus hoagii]|nr:DUF2637 domain-containing protein [Prescottella equi]NKS85652.1 DUF2637 domain-containing protein [Prescottella equi]NKT12000.1 DUF2637 domain-containing protein [Prescottella equi]NKT12064.1 DUF2637 domain-containing protein [Prescottella equi]NKT61518.1 DUF2637 domain-containing protein [Prescottella equi]